jgi:putative FmdB family regulatory protein
MTTYVYGCGTCGELFEYRERMPEHKAGKPKCPKCGGEDVAWAYSRFSAKTAKKS